MTSNDQHFATERFKAYMIVADLSYRQLALRLGVSPRRVQHWRHGVNPAPDLWPRIAKELGVRLSDLTVAR